MFIFYYFILVPSHIVLHYNSIENVEYKSERYCISTYRAKTVVPLGGGYPYIYIYIYICIVEWSMKKITL